MSNTFVALIAELPQIQLQQVGNPVALSAPSGSLFVEVS